MKNSILIGLIVGGLIFTNTMATGGTIYVDTNASGSDTGADWSNAFTNLQDGLASSSSGDEIWVAQGTYYPGTARSDTFQLVSGVVLYGGFASGDAFGDRDWINKETILSGDIGTQGVLTDNSYHIITSTTNVNINGFTVRDGYADGTAPDDQGAAFTHTVNYSGSSKTIENCLFLDNFATNRGGAIYIYDTDANETIKNCTFRGNHAYDRGGAIHRNDPNVAYANFYISDCTFIDNSTATLVNSKGYGAAIYLYHAYPKITNCVFSGNSARYGGGIATENANYRAYAGHGVFNSIFSDNYGYSAGGAVAARGMMPIKNSVFFGNSTTESGGALSLISDIFASPNLPVTGSVFGGNYSHRYGGAIDLYGAKNTNIVVNCTFVENEQVASYDARYGGGALNIRNGSIMDVKNCIFWQNTAAVGRGDSIYSNVGTGMVSYCDIPWDVSNVATSSNGGSITAIIGNIDENPLFGSGFTGSWTGDGVYDAETGQTILTNSSANWTTDELVGMGLNPDTGAGKLQFYVAGNSATSIKVWGDATEGKSGDDYKVFDYRLQSGNGRWVAGTETWEKDAKYSPCIDVGDPADDFASEPDPNGKRINIGAYGGTDTASKSKYMGTVIMIK